MSPRPPLSPRLLLATPLLLGACTSGGDDPSADAEAPSAYTYTPEADDSDGPGDLDLDAVAAALQQVFAESRTLNARPVLDTYQDILAQSDAGCPSYYEQDGNIFWYASCTAASGAAYSGYAFYNVYEGVDLFGDGNAWDADALFGTADMVDATGTGHVHLGGSAYVAEAVSQDGALLWYTAVTGAFFGDTAAAQGTWMESGQAPAMSLYAARYDQADVNILYLFGNAALSGEVTAMSTEGLAIYTYVPGIYPCAEEPMGALALRDAEGRWYELTFDINPETLAVRAGGACDGCGTLSYKGEEVGQVCIDGSVLVDWEVTPW